MRPVSSSVRQALWAQETDKVFLYLLEIQHPSLGTPLRFVRNNEAITSNGNVYQPYPFTGNLMPDDKDGMVYNLQLVIDNIDQSMTQLMRSISDPPTVFVSIVVADNPNVIEVGPLRYKVSGITYDVQTISANLIIDDGLEDEIPYLKFTPAEFPGVFK